MSGLFPLWRRFWRVWGRGGILTLLRGWRRLWGGFCAVAGQYILYIARNFFLALLRHLGYIAVNTCDGVKVCSLVDRNWPIIAGPISKTCTRPIASAIACTIAKSAPIYCVGFS